MRRVSILFIMFGCLFVFCLCFGGLIYSIINPEDLEKVFKNLAIFSSLVWMVSLLVFFGLAVSVFVEFVRCHRFTLWQDLAQIGEGFISILEAFETFIKGLRGKN